VAATLKDVALRAGVSIKTVSNVVNGYVHVKEEMRERVRVALDELNYQPNLSARYLRTGRMGVITLAIPDLSNAYFSDIGNAVIAAASSQSYTVLIDHTDGERAKERLVIDGLRPHLIDGIILSPLGLEAEDIQVRKVQIPLVLLGERFLSNTYDHVSIDNVAAARLATNHLLELGRRRIAAIGAPNALIGETETARLRMNGYTEALTQKGLPIDPSLVISMKPTHAVSEPHTVRVMFYKREGGAEAMHQLLALEHPPDAVFCFNDLMALGAIHVLHKAGYRVPDDVAVVGFDDIEEGRFSTPPLTTIAPDKKMIGELAVSFLLGRINGTRTVEPEHVEVPFQLVIRESTAG